jgi:hypothetical protein
MRGPVVVFSKNHLCTQGIEWKIIIGERNHLTIGATIKLTTVILKNSTQHKINGHNFEKYNTMIKSTDVILENSMLQ